MRKLTEAERNRIKTAVQNAEKFTSGEIVPLVVPKSGDYFWVMPLLAFKGLVLLTIAYEFKVYFSGFPGTLMELVTFQFFGVALGVLLAFIPSVARWAIGRVRLEKDVHHRAVVSFVKEGVTKTKDRTGVLIYISMFERQVEVLGDQGIHRHVGDEFWKSQSHQLALMIGEGKLIEGLEATIQQVGENLQKHFPIAEDDTNELSDDFRSKE